MHVCFLRGALSAAIALSTSSIKVEYKTRDQHDMAAAGGLLALVFAAFVILFIDAQLATGQQHQQVVFGAGPVHPKEQQSPTQHLKRVAIIGAGPGGSSTAFFLSKAQEKLQSLGRENEGFEVTVFEREERIGGRTAVVHPYFDKSLPAIELGASIFADVNKNLKRAAKVCVGNMTERRGAA